jgi:Ca-activated chloride channel homolog
VIVARPEALWLLILVPTAAAFFAHGFRRKRKTVEMLGEPRVLAKIVDPAAARRQRVKAVFLGLAVLFLALAAAGPRWGRTFQEIRRRGVDVIIAVDLSESMRAEDAKPNRLAAAKRELGLLINGLDGDRVGVVAFAGTAFLQCPLTLDYGAAQLLLDVLETDAVAAPGTSLAAAIHAACDAFPGPGKEHKALVLLTDGEDHSRELPAAVERAEEEGVRIFAIGFGSPDGEIIPVRDGQGNLVEYKKDKSGKTVVTRLGEAALRDAALQTNGQYYRATQGEVEVERVLADIQRMEKKSLESRQYDRYHDRFRWPLAAAFLFLLLEFLWPETVGHWSRLAQGLGSRAPTRFRGLRRAGKGVLPGAWVWLALLAMPGRLAANDPAASESSVPQEPAAAYNAGYRLYRKGDFQAAAESFRAVPALSSDVKIQARSFYNEGNALFRLGRWEESVEKYKHALRLNPKDMDAKHNLELAQKMRAAQPAAQDNGQDPSKDSPDKQAKGSDRAQNQEPKKDSSAKSRGRPAMSKEDAERLLQAMDTQEKEARKRKKAAAARRSATEQDW